MIRVLHSFGIMDNSIGESSPIAFKILSLAVNGYSTKTPKAMVIPREVFHKTLIRVPYQDTFGHKIINAQASPLFKNVNLHQKRIIHKDMTISAFLVYDGLNEYLNSITIYRHINTLDNLNKPAIQSLLTFLHACMTSRLVYATRTFIPPSVFMDSTPHASQKWVPVPVLRGKKRT